MDAKSSNASAPHLHGGSSVAAHHWKRTIALLPLGGVCLWQSGFNALGLFAASLIGGLAAETLAGTFLKKRIKLLDGSTVLNSFLFALLLPSQAPYGMAAGGAFFGFLIGREIFGGMAAGPFQPALAARVLFEACFPWVFSPDAVIFGNGGLAAAALLAGAVFLLFQKLITWDTPLIYWAALSVLFLSSGSGAAAFFSPFVLFSAFFLLTDPSSAPLSVLGRRIFAGTAAMAVFLFNPGGGASSPFVCGLLTAEILTPWLDRLIRPAARLA